MPYINTNGIKMYYEEKGSGEPLILIMGFGAPGSLWELHANEYSKHFRCIMIDNRGVGNSDQPIGPYSSEMMASDVAGLMDELNIESCRVAGISMGGTIAQSLALNHPNKVKSMVLISTWGKFDKYAISVYENLIKLRKVCDPADFMELIQLWIFATDYFEKNIKDLKQGQIDARNNPNPQSENGFDGQLNACMSHDSINDLNKINIPTLIVVGENDIFTPLAFSLTLHEKILNSKILRIPRTGHACHWEDLELFNNETTKFLIEN